MKQWGSSILVKLTAEYVGQVFDELDWIFRYKGERTEFNILC